MSDYKVNVFVFGKDIDDLLFRTVATLTDVEFGEFVSIVGGHSLGTESGDALAVEKRKSEMLKWCFQHGSKRVLFDSVSQIIVRFVAEDDGEPVFLRLID